MNDFDQKAREWDKNKMHLDRTLAVAGQLQKQVTFKPQMKALEFGAGTGLLSFHMEDRFSEITLLDSSEEMLKVAENKIKTSDHTKFKTLYLNLETEDYIGDPFDIIYSQMVFHHIKDLNLIFQKLYNLLNPGGILAIADLYPEDGSFHDFNADVHRGFVPEKLIELALNHGFHDSKVSLCFVIRKEISAEKIKEYPVFLLTGIK